MREFQDMDELLESALADPNEPITIALDNNTWIFSIDINEQWHWELIDKHSNTIKKSSEGFLSLRNCVSNANRITSSLIPSYEIVKESFYASKIYTNLSQN